MSGARHVWGASLMSGAFGQCDSRHTIIHVCVQMGGLVSGSLQRVYVYIRSSRGKILPLCPFEKPWNIRGGYTISERGIRVTAKY